MVLREDAHEKGNGNVGLNADANVAVALALVVSTVPYVPPIGGSLPLQMIAHLASHPMDLYSSPKGQHQMNGCCANESGNENGNSHAVVAEIEIWAGVVVVAEIAESEIGTARSHEQSY